MSILQHEVHNNNYDAYYYNADTDQGRSTESASNNHRNSCPSQSSSPSSNKDVEQEKLQSTLGYRTPCHSIHASDRPTMKELTTLLTPKGKINIIKEVTPIWKETGRHLDFDNEGTQLNIIEGKCRTPEDCCAEMFQHWLYGNGELCSWASLVKLLQECGRKHLAEKIRSCYS